MGPVWATDAVVNFKAAKKGRLPKPRARKVEDRGVPLAEIAERLLRAVTFDNAENMYGTH